MKSGIVSPAYDPTTITTFKYGPSAFAAIGTPLYHDWNSDDSGIGNTDGAHYGAFQCWNVTPGVRVISALSVWAAFLRSTHVTALYVEVWTATASDYVLVASSGAIAPAVGSTGSERTTLTLARPLSVTLEAGKTYYVGLRVIRTAANAATPYIAARSDGIALASPHFRFTCKPANWNGLTISKTSVANALYTYTDDEILMMEVTYTSPNYLETDITTVAAKSYLIPRASVQPSIVKLESVAVADSEKLTVVITDWYPDQAVTQDTIILDCGDTTPGTNTLTCKANSVTLADIGGNGQEGKTFDLIYGIRPVADKADLYWQCRHLEVAVHSHATAAAGSRGALYSYGAETSQRVFTLSGTFTVGKLRVGIKPIVLMGDSQVVDGSGTNLRGPHTSRLGNLCTELTKERVWILAGQSGQTLSGIMSDIFRNATPGTADAVELLGLDCDWFYSGCGINDISAYTTASDADARESVADLVQLFCALSEYILAANERMILAGMPPYSVTSDQNPSYYADQYEAKCVRWYNRALLGLALAWRVPFYNPWLDMVEKGTESDAIPAFDATYSDDSLHYNATGAAIVLPQIVSSVETATIDTRDQYDGDTGGLGVSGYSDSARITTNTLDADTASRTQLQQALNDFGDQMEALLDARPPRTRDKQTFKDKLIDLTRWLSATLR